MPKIPRVERVEFTRCPYDASPVEAEPCSNGSTLLCCFTCGAAWQWYKTWLRRIREPDREAVRRARAGREPRQIRGVREPDVAEAAWRRVRVSSSSAAGGQVPPPPSSWRR